MSFDAPSPAIEALFDTGRIGRGLIVRGFRSGDRIRPLGMTGTRKVQDVFVDCKLARASRATWPLIEAESGFFGFPAWSVAVMHWSLRRRKPLAINVKRDANTENTSLLRN